jgi:hypothetical protein
MIPKLRTLPFLGLAVLCLAFAFPATAQDDDPVPETEGFDPLFFGYETEPGMGFGGRTVASLQSLGSRAFSSIPGVRRHPAIAPAFEFPLAALLILVQHEVGGHGGRGREFGLSPSYGFGFDFSGYTTTERPPDTNEENALLAVGGAEADGVMARRILLDALRPEGVEGAKIPLAMMGKLDVTMYVLGTPEPDDGDDFADAYREGNDVAFYLATRQAVRAGEDPADVWNGVYRIDTGDPALEEMRDDAQVTAVWNALDPSLVAAVFSYFRDHVIGGRTRVRPPVLRIRDGLGLTLGTRGVLGPQDVSRFLDLYAVTPRAILAFYVRDLDSSIDREYGIGAAVHGLRLSQRLDLGLQADWWGQPESLEVFYPAGEDGWNASAEINALFGRWGFSAKAGTKSEGFFPGTPQDEGVYAGFGLQAVW